ncbi:hypothetical protein X975_17498, partial [Stegodyphus mimosarum]
MSSKLSRKCFVPGCISGHRNATKVSLFKVPKDEKLRREWAKRISRGDKELSIQHSVCELHFEQHFIDKFYNHVVNGEDIKIPRGKPLLKPEAIPSIFPKAPKYFNKPLPKKRKDRSNVTTEAKTMCVNKENHDASEISVSRTMRISDVETVQLPSPFWSKLRIKNCPQSLVFVNLIFDKNLEYPLVRKLISVIEKNNKLTADVFMCG